jgi:hypothetical protein
VLYSNFKTNKEVWPYS